MRPLYDDVAWVDWDRLFLSKDFYHRFQTFYMMKMGFFNEKNNETFKVLKEIL